MLDLSIVIPIYNTPVDKLKRCFDSIRLSKDISYEVLLIDDGSKSFVGQFCKEYIKKRIQFNYIRKENGGVSETRNLGIDLANGKFLMFVDSDDKVRLNKLNKNILNTNYDLIIFDYITKLNNKFYFNKVCKDIYSGPININDLIENLINLGKLNQPWAKIYNLNYIKKKPIKFNIQMVQGEDLEFICKYLIENPKIFYASIPIYIYYYNYNNWENRVNKFSNKIIEDIYLETNKLKDVVNKFNFNEDIKNTLFNNINKKIINLLFMYTCELCRINKINKEIEQKIEIIILTSLSQKTSLINRIKVILIKKKYWQQLKFIGIIANFRRKLKNKI